MASLAQESMRLMSTPVKMKSVQSKADFDS